MNERDWINTRRFTKAIVGIGYLIIGVGCLFIPAWHWKLIVLGWWLMFAGIAVKSAMDK